VPQTDINTETGGCMYGEGLLMMSAWRSKRVELYTYREKIKIYYKLHLLVYLLEYMKMHGPGNIKLWIQAKAPDDGRKHRPKHVEPTWNNKLICIVHLFGYFHSCITMHGFMYVKFSLNGGRNNAVGMVTRYGLDGLGVRIPVGVKHFSLLQNAQTAPRDTSSSFVAGKVAGLGLDHPSLLFSSKPRVSVLVEQHPCPLACSGTGFTLFNL
jgi:hypothetical protein